jgi:hypothetical protein
MRWIGSRPRIRGNQIKNKADPGKNDAPGHEEVRRASVAEVKGKEQAVPDALRPGSANDVRNRSKVEPLHHPEGAGEQ